jgi:hypothetical protein
MKIKIGPLTINKKDIAAVCSWLKLKSRSPRSLSNYFRVINSEVVDVYVFQLGLRPNIPVIDLLYLSFLLEAIRNNRAKKIIIFPSVDLSSPWQDNAAAMLMKKYVKEFFCDRADQIDFIDPFSIAEQAKKVDLFSKEFLSIFRYISNSDFIQYANDQLKLNVKSYSDYCRFHPVELRLLNIYVHVARSYVIWKEKIEKMLPKEGEAPLKLGILIWETEVDKLGFFHWQRFENSANIELSVALGGTLMADKHRALPVFDSSKALDILGEKVEIYRKICSMNSRELKLYREVLRTIRHVVYGHNVSQYETDSCRNLIEGISLTDPKLSSGEIGRLGRHVFSNWLELSEELRGQQ